jgi:hypothetical protein
MAQKNNFIKKIARWILFILLCPVVLLIVAAIQVALYMKPGFATGGADFCFCLALYHLIIRKNKRKAFGELISGIIIFLFGGIGAIIALIIFYYSYKERREELIKAIEKGDKEKVKELLDKRAEINIRDNDGWTPLMYASKNNDLEIIKLLLEKGANVNLTDKYGQTALILASANGHKEAVELLLEKGADVNIQDEDGWTALMFASQNGYKEVVELLIEKGADVNAKDNLGKTALMLAAQNGHEEIVELLKSYGAKK